MCVIAYKPRGKSISDATIRKMFYHNPDGAGFMYPSKGVVKYEKGFFNVEELIARYRACVNDDMPSIIHCRIATHGGTSRALCHPFPIARHSKEFKQKGESFICMAHNGVLPDYAFKPYADNRDSDTSAYVHKLYIKGLRKLPDESLVKTMENEINGSRLIFMDGKGETKRVGSWSEKDGIWFSNLNHEKYSSWRFPVKKSTSAEIEREADRACLIRANDIGFVVNIYGDYVDASDAYTDGASIFVYKGNHKWAVDNSRQFVTWY